MHAYGWLPCVLARVLGLGFSLCMSLGDDVGANVT
eukprot:SAG11_NODE_34204_length_273_cov_0.724138_1_plen_34_part_01